ncbi:MAG: energy-coupling factor transporter ATPase [Firmicutes bacterium]|nr:energy-coupling factor transporter ATPase [Bacillota bacterium]
MDSIISVQDIYFSYDESDEGQQVLKGISLEIERGSFVAVVGPNGSGKSTFAKQLNALLLPQKGRVLAGGMDTADDSLLWDIRRTVGMVFQNPDNQLVSAVVEDDVAFGPENIGVPSEEIRRRVDEALAAVGMTGFEKHAPHNLSGGQKQRIAIAGVLAMQPDVIVFDEPTAMLDPRGRGEIMKIIEELHDSGKTVILITHFMEEAAKADRIVVLRDGKVDADGTPREIFSMSARLHDMKLELPFAVELARRLREDGLKLPEDILSEEELAEALCSLK